MEITLRAPALTPSPSARPPLVGLTPDEVAGLHEALVAYHREFALLFKRAEQRHWALKYTEGQLLPLERKSIEPMADALDGGNVQALQQFIGVGAWDDEAILARHQQLIAETLGEALSTYAERAVVGWHEGVLRRTMAVARAAAGSPVTARQVAKRSLRVCR